MAKFELKPFKTNPIFENSSPGAVPYNSFYNQYWNVPKDNDYDPINNKWNDKYLNTSRSEQFGVPIVSPFKFNNTIDGKEPNGKNYYVNPSNQFDKDNALILDNLTLDSAIITVRQSKNIISTKIPGRDGQILELIGLDNYQVDIEGVITGINGQYPIDAVKVLFAYCNIKSPISVTCNYLWEIFSINYLVVKSYDISQEIGGISQQRYKITFVDDRLSDSDVLLSPYGPTPATNI